MDDATSILSLPDDPAILKQIIAPAALAIAPARPLLQATRRAGTI